MAKCCLQSPPPLTPFSAPRHLHPIPRSLMLFWCPLGSHPDLPLDTMSLLPPQKVQDLALAYCQHTVQMYANPVFVRFWETEPCWRTYKLHYKQSVPYFFSHVHFWASVFSVKYALILIVSSNQIVRNCRQEFYDIIFWILHTTWYFNNRRLVTWNQGE